MPGQTRMWWIKHFRDMHKRREDPGPDDMLKHEEAFLLVLEEHREVHKHFYVGHEHSPSTGLVIPGRTK